MTTNALKISAPALGTWAWGDSGAAGEGYFGSGTGRAEFDQIALQADACGLTLWDTATVYGMGRSETLLGEVLRHLPRDAYQLSTKFTPQAAGDGPDAMATMLEQSLARLGTDYIDLYWIHNAADVEKWTPQVVPLLRQGRVRHVGVSNHDLTQIVRANEILGESGYRVEAVQNHYSLLHRSSERAGILAHCREQAMPFVAYMVLEQGALSGLASEHKRLPERTDRAQRYNGLLPRLDALNRALSEVGRKHDASGPEVAIAWALAKGATPVIGVTRSSHIASLSRATRLTLPAEDVAALEAVADLAGVSTRGWWEQEMTAAA